ncbi:MAG: hypothetical protein ACN6PN_19635, partial [Sphingobacterium sp.]
YGVKTVRGADQIFTDFSKCGSFGPLPGSVGTGCVDKSDLAKKICCLENKREAPKYWIFEKRWRGI